MKDKVFAEVTQGGLKVIGDGTVLKGCAFNIPCPEKVRSLVVDGVELVQEGDTLIMRARAGKGGSR